MNIFLIDENGIFEKALIEEDIRFEKISADNAEYYLKSGIYDLMIIDADNGPNIVRRLKNNDISLPIIAAAYGKTRVEYLVSGAQCCIEQSKRELLAALRGLIKRTAKTLNDDILLGDIKLDTLCMVIKNKFSVVPLTQKEFDILYILSSEKGSIVPKEKLIMKVWGWDTETSENNVEAVISNLRKKLLRLTEKVFIKAKRNAGYYIDIR